MAELLESLHLNETFFAQLASFLLLVWLLSKVAFKPIMRALVQRQEHIAQMLSQAEKDREEAEKIKEEYRAEMQKARQEAHEILERAAKQGEGRAQEIIAQAQEEASRMKKSALEEIEREKDKALAQLRDEVATLSVMVAGKILRKNLDVTGQQALVKEFIQEVGELQ